MNHGKPDISAEPETAHFDGLKPLSLEEAADFLRMAPETLRRKARSGEVPAAKPGKQWVFIAEDLIEFVRSQYSASTQSILTNRKQTRSETWLSSSVAKKASITPISQRRTEKEYESLLRPQTK
ncbi:MAG: helix-turn-helix domain-containing protein [Sedimenticola sp.]